MKTNKINMYRGITREALSAKIEEVRSDLETFVSDETNSATSRESFSALLEKTDREVIRSLGNASIVKLNKLEKASEVNELERMAETKTMDDYFRIVRSIDLYAALDKYSEMKYNDATSAYMEDQTVKTYAPKFNKKAGEWEEVEKAEYLRPYDFFRTVLSTAEMPQLLDGMRIMRENFICFNLLNDKGEAAHLDRKPLPESAIVYREQLGWKDYKTKARLKEQLVQCWKWMLGEASPEKAFAADVTFILNAVVEVKDRANESGAYKERDSATLTDLVFRAAYGNLQGKAYLMMHADDFGKVESVQRNEAMAEQPTKDEAKTKIGKVTTKEEPKPEKKPAAKKSEPKPETKAEESQPKK